jgi:uncharacterized protein YkwD
MSKKTIKIIILALVSAILPFTVFAGIYMFRGTLQPQPTPEPTPPINETPAEPTHPMESPHLVVEAESIRILLETAEMPIGTRFFPEVIILPRNATDKSYSLHSDNEIIIRPQGHNWIAAEIGTANLIATASNGITATVEITVTAHELEELSFEHDELTMLAGTQTDLSLVFYPADAVIEEPIRFSSSNDRIATVTTRGGNVHAISEGTVTITAQAGDIVAELKITVFAPDLEALAEEVLILTNYERENAGLFLLEYSSHLTQAAIIRADEIRSGEVSHTRPDGSQFETVLDELEILYAFAGENIAAGQRSPTEVIRAWMHSNDHRAKILNEDFVYLGVGIAMDDNGKFYWVQIFMY